MMAKGQSVQFVFDPYIMHTPFVFISRLEPLLLTHPYMINGDFTKQITGFIIEQVPKILARVCENSTHGGPSAAALVSPSSTEGFRWHFCLWFKHGTTLTCQYFTVLAPNQNAENKVTNSYI